MDGQSRGGPRSEGPACARNVAEIIPGGNAAGYEDGKELTWPPNNGKTGLDGCPLMLAIDEKKETRALSEGETVTRSTSQPEPPTPSGEGKDKFYSVKKQPVQRLQTRKKGCFSGGEVQPRGDTGQASSGKKRDPRLTAPPRRRKSVSI